MSNNLRQSDKLHKAKNAKFDEFYTQYIDIQNEVNAYLEFDKNVFKDKTILLPCDDPEWSNFTKFFAQNFERFGLKKLISTSYAYESKQINEPFQLSLFESESPKFDAKKTKSHGKIFILEKDNNNSGHIDINDLKWDYLEGDGDFRSEEVKKLRDEADIIITNPPFSLYREFVSWLIDSQKKFLIIGNKLSPSNKEIFPLFMNNKMWSGKTKWSGGLWFETKSTNDIDKVIDGKNMKNVAAVWFTNMEHGRRHDLLNLMTMDDNKKFSKHKEIRDVGYMKYDNYDAIEIPYSDSIPSDYNGIMGVPISFLEKYNPEQFIILGCTQRGCHDKVPDTKKYNDYVETKQNGELTGSSGIKTNENACLEQNDGKHNYFINKSGHIIQSAPSRVFIKWKENAPGFIEKDSNV